MDWGHLREFFGGFTFWLVVGWLIAILSLLWNIHQFRHSRRTKVITQITCEKSLDTSQEHVRFLTINVLNDGTELNDMNVILSFPRKEDGKTVRIPLSIYTTREVPNPFKFGYSCSWHIPNDDPSKPVEFLDGIPLDKIVFEVFSRSRPVAVVFAKKWKKAMHQFMKPDPRLPKKPERKPMMPGMIAPGEWMAGKPKW